MPEDERGPAPGLLSGSPLSDAVPPPEPAQDQAPGPQRELQRLRLAFRERRAQGDAKGMAALAREALDRFADEAEAHQMLVQSHMAADEWEPALRAVRAGLNGFPDDRPLLERGVAISRKLGRSDLAIGWMKRLAQDGPDAGKWLAELGKQMTQSFDGQQGLRHLQAAVRGGIPQDDLLLHLALAAERAGDPPLAARYWAQMAETDPSLANRERARGALRRIEAHAVTAARPDVKVEGLEGLLAVAPGADGRAVRASTTDGDVAIWRTGGSRDLVLFFGGIAVMMGAVRPTVLPEVRTRSMNGLSFSDPRRLLMLGGSPTLGVDYAASLRALRRVVEAWEIERVFVVGLSAGGYPALRFGVDLKAAGVLLLSAGTTPPEGDTSPLVSRLRASLGGMAVDIRDYIERHGSGVPVIAAYGSDNADDAWQSERLRGLPNVDLKPIPGFSAHSLASHEGLPALYDALFAG